MLHYGFLGSPVARAAEVAASGVRSADELDGDSEVEAGPVAVGRDYGEVESFGEREAGAVGERESVRFEGGRSRRSRRR